MFDFIQSVVTNPVCMGIVAFYFTILAIRVRA